MSAAADVALVDRLRSLPTETEWVEFKRNRCEPQELGEYLSALANGAALAGEPRGYLLFGIDDVSHEVVGTRFDAHAEEGKGNQDLLPWMAAGLRPNPGFEVRQVDHPDGRVVVFEVGPAKDQQVAFYGTEHVRIGSSKTELARHPEKERSLWTRGSDWSTEVIDGVTLDEIEPEAIAMPDCLTEQQKLRRISNLLQELRRSGAIVNRSSRTRPGWVLTTLALPVDDAT